MFLYKNIFLYIYIFLYIFKITSRSRTPETKEFIKFSQSTEIKYLST